MKELGAYLKRVRISNGVNIAEAAEDLELTVTELENIESGNVKAFRDLYDLRNDIKVYAKYLGLKPDEVTDKFNDFLFEHTSKISLDDIRSAQKKSQDKPKKVKSPYTKEYKKKSYALPVVLVGIAFLLIIMLIIYLVLKGGSKVPTRTDELSSNKEDIIYEFTY